MTAAAAQVSLFCVVLYLLLTTRTTTWPSCLLVQLRKQSNPWSSKESRLVVEEKTFCRRRFSKLASRKRPLRDILYHCVSMLEALKTTTLRKILQWWQQQRHKEYVLFFYVTLWLRQVLLLEVNLL